jgi:uroporphyrinogen decarboxylase
MTCVLPFEAAAGMDVVETRRQFPKLQMIGGLNKMTIARGEVEMRAEVDRKVGSLVGKGGYIPSFDHSVPPIISLEDYKKYLDYLRTVGEKALRS